ncbi:hypothetical protein D9M70_555910 [compost metagenome]
MTVLLQQSAASDYPRHSIDRISYVQARPSRRQLHLRPFESADQEVDEATRAGTHGNHECQPILFERRPVDILVNIALALARIVVIVQSNGCQAVTVARGFRRAIP